jgi:hypothetical protein
MGVSTKQQAMTINLNTSPSVPFPVPAEKTLLGYRMAPSDEAEDGGQRKVSPLERSLAGADDLPYRVELWDDEKKAVEQILAVTANASIGYAAYYAATREHPQRYVVLRHKRSIVSRWNGPEH